MQRKDVSAFLCIQSVRQRDSHSHRHARSEQNEYQQTNSVPARALVNFFFVCLVLFILCSEELILRSITNHAHAPNMLWCVRTEDVLEQVQTIEADGQIICAATKGFHPPPVML